jgi:hypothetical protein
MNFKTFWTVWKKTKLPLTEDQVSGNYISVESDFGCSQRNSLAVQASMKVSCCCCYCCCWLVGWFCISSRYDWEHFGLHQNFLSEHSWHGSGQCSDASSSSKAQTLLFVTSSKPQTVLLLTMTKPPTPLIFISMKLMTRLVSYVGQYWPQFSSRRPSWWHWLCCKYSTSWL